MTANANKAPYSMYTDKICERAAVASRAQALCRPLVFTNGVFDLLHLGHVECLEAAQRQGASLVVGLNTDLSVQRLSKGPGRPLNPEIERAAVIAALQCVSLVVLFDEDTPLALLGEIRPDIYVKGGDYHKSVLPEATLMQQWGGITAILDYLPGHSTTALIRRAHHIHAMENSL